MKRLLIILIACCLFAACTKDGLQQYSEKSRIYLSLRRDSLYSKFPLSSAGNIQIDYAPQKSTKQKDTLKLTIQTSGAAVNADRIFAFERNTAMGTAVEGTDFDLLDKNFVIPAGKLNSSVRVVVNRSLSMAKAPVSFGYTLKANDNFELGPDRDTIRFTSAAAVMKMVALKITARDVLTKLANWDSFIANYFGAYSQVKHRFIIDVLPAPLSLPSTTSASRMNTNRNNLRTALTKYNATHPEKLKDENGIEISF